MQTNNKTLLILFAFLVAACATPTATEDPLLPRPSVTPFPTARPTQEGTWAGMDYRDMGWVLIQYDGYEEREHPLLDGYYDGQDVLTFPEVKGCGFHSWYGGKDGYDLDEWDFITTKEMIGKNNYAVTYLLLRGKLTEIIFVFVSEEGNEIDYPYLGSLRLRFDEGFAAECHLTATKLLETLDVNGLLAQREVTWEQQFGYTEESSD